jgi:Rieske Fe-S protein
MSEPTEGHAGETPPAPQDRRTFLSRASSLAMVGGLAAGYGTLGYMAGRFLYPAHGEPSAWLFVGEAARLARGDVISYTTPSGQTVTIRRRAEEGTEEDFLALSSTCPHLGCKVHWEGQNDRFFCPCHNGVFDPQGKAIAGPPGEAGLSLPHYPLRLADGLLYIEVPVSRPRGQEPEA